MNNSEEAKEQRYADDSEIHACRRTRSFVVFMLFTGVANAYVMRTNMSVAIVAMVNHTALAVQANDTTRKNAHDGEFVWSYKLQGYILASFFYGYVITQVPFGFLIKNFGAKLFLGWGMLLNSVAAFLVPVAARKGGPVALCMVRFIQGLGEGPIVPCTHSMLAHWIPPHERSRAGAAVYAGAQFGTIVSMPLSGLLAEYGFDGGWPSIFYVFGAVGVLWSILFLLLVYETPEQHPKISNAERQHIVQSIWEAESRPEMQKTPFKSIALSMPFWAIMIAHVGQNYGYETLMTEMPTYMAMVLKLQLKSNGLLSALPYLAMWIMAMVFAVFADCMIKRNVSITTTRKIMNSFGEYGPAVALMIVGYLHESVVLTVLLFAIGLGLNGAIYSGFKVNHMDLSPIFAGLLISLTNCTANLVGLTAPMIAGHIIDHDPSVRSWRIVFFIAAAVYVLCASIYNIFASGKRKW